MKQAYTIINSKLLITNTKQRLKRPLSFWIRKILWCSFGIMIFCFTGFVFYVVLYPEGNLFDVVSLGAVFATLGSTLVSIASLLCNKYYEEFMNCMDTLKNELITQNLNFNWLFLKKKEIIKKSKNEYLMYQASSPKVVFEIGAVNLSIEVPTQKKDFYESELLKKIFEMKISKKVYISYLSKNADSIMESGLYMWECVYHILCSAFFYIFYCNLIIIGTIFFLSGLLATFLYPIIF